MTRLLHPVPESLEMLGGMGRSTLYELIADGSIQTVKIGRRTFIPHDELVRYVESLSTGDGRSFEPEPAA